MAAREGPTSSAGATTVAWAQPDAPNGATAKPRANCDRESAPPAPAQAPMLVKGLIQTTLAHMRLDKDQLRNAVRKWYAESGLDAANVANQATAAERSALVKAVVAELAVKVGGWVRWGWIAAPPRPSPPLNTTAINSLYFTTPSDSFGSRSSCRVSGWWRGCWPSSSSHRSIS